MADVREYKAIINGAETTVQLTEDEAKRLGAVPINSSETPTDPATIAPAGGVVDTKARTDVKNKAVGPGI
jgi:hypothetical protein